MMRAATLSAPVLWAALLALEIPAQNPNLRDFEKVFLARREAWIDSLMQEAAPEQRRDCLRHLHRALHGRGKASLSHLRCRELAKAAAILQGIPFAMDEDGEADFSRSPELRRFLARFNFFLLGLPEVVDPAKKEADLDRVRSIQRGLLPRWPLRPDQEKMAEGAGLIHLTARGTFPFTKPGGLELHFEVLDAGGAGLGRKERGDSEDPEGWRFFDLVASFEMGGRPVGEYGGRLRLGFQGSRPGTLDPPVEVRFFLRPGFHESLWRLFDLRKELSERAGREELPAGELATLDVCTIELMRVFLHGNEYVFRPWPLEALDLALETAGALKEGQRPELPPRGDRVFGIPVPGGPAEAVRLIWGPPSEKGRWGRARLYFAPADWDEGFATHGLGIPVEGLQEEGLVHAFLRPAGGKAYLRAVQDLLKTRFGPAPEATTLVGLQGGSIRAGYALPILEGKLGEFVMIGSKVPDDPLLASEKVESFRVIPAWGLPEEKALDLYRERDGKRPHQRVRVVENPEGSLRAALGLLGS